MTETAGIYVIVNTANAKIYVGSAIHPFARRQVHFSRLRHGKHANRHLQAAWNKYGAQCFEFRILEQVPFVGLLKTREQVWLDQLRPWENGYNILHTADSRRGHIVSVETRAKMSAAHRGQTKTVEHRKAIKESLKGRVWYKEQGKSHPFEGRQHSKETLEKMRMAH